MFTTAVNRPLASVTLCILRPPILTLSTKEFFYGYTLAAKLVQKPYSEKLASITSFPFCLIWQSSSSRNSICGPSCFSFKSDRSHCVLQELQKFQYPSPDLCLITILHLRTVLIQSNVQKCIKNVSHAGINGGYIYTYIYMKKVNTAQLKLHVFVMCKKRN